MKLFNNLLVSFTLLLTVGSINQVQAAICFLDNYNYCWKFSPSMGNAIANYYSGEMWNFMGGPFGAAATELKPINGGVSISSDFGTSFHYDLQWGMFNASGAWANSNGGNHGVVTSFLPIPCPCSSFPISSKASDFGPLPGESRSGPGRSDSDRPSRPGRSDLSR